MSFRRLLLFITTCSAILACKSVTEGSQSTLSSTNTKGSYQICLATSGNGFNYASTLAWFSESFRLAAVDGGVSAKFDIECIAGSSSGSAVLGIMTGVIRNQKLFPGGINTAGMSQAQLLKLSAALKYMSIASDLTSTEANTYTNTGCTVGEGDPSFGTRNLWESSYCIDRLLFDFGNRILIARNMNDSSIGLIQAFDNLQTYTSLSSLKSAVGQSNIQKAFRSSSDKVKADVRKVFEASMTSYRWQGNRVDINDRTASIQAFMNDANHPIRRILAEPPVNGFLTLTFASIGFSSAVNPIEYRKAKQTLPEFKDVQTMTQGNKSTITTILQSANYKSFASAGKHFESFILAPVTTVASLVRNSIREPELNPAGQHGLTPYTFDKFGNGSGITEYFNPTIKAKLSLGSSFEFISPFTKLNGQRPYIDIYGGFMDAFISGLPLIPLLEDKIKKNNSSKVWFGTLSRRAAIGDFAKKQVRKYFAGPNNQTEANLSVFLRLRDHLDGQVTALASRTNKQIPLTKSYIEWELPVIDRGNFNQTLQNTLIKIFSPSTRLPAAIVQQGHYLMTRGINSVRHGLNLDRNAQLPYVYDRSYEDGVYELGRP